MWLTTIATLFVLMETTDGGYVYSRPNITLMLPKIESNFEQINYQKPVQEYLPKQTIESVVTYSVPLQHYYELQKDNSNLLSDNLKAVKEIDDITSEPFTAVNQENNLAIESSPYQNIPAINTQYVEFTTPLKNQQNDLGLLTNPVANTMLNENSEVRGNAYSLTNVLTIPENIRPAIKEESGLEVNTVQYNNIAQNLPNVNLLAPTIHQSNLEFKALQQFENPNTDIPIVDAPAAVQQSSVEFATHQHIIQENENNDLNTLRNVQNVVSPKITKHIYFHVPPPEIEEPSVRTVKPKIKDYKIIFIKVPSHSRGNYNNQVAPIDEKTVIYVLTKKPMTQQVPLPKPVPNKHEVFFVNYNGDAGTAITQISNNLEELRS